MKKTLMLGILVLLLLGIVFISGCAKECMLQSNIKKRKNKRKIYISFIIINIYI